MAATYGTIDVTRQIGFANLTARGDTESVGAGATAGVGVVLQAGSFMFEPRIGLDYDHNDQDSFTERGGGGRQSPGRRRRPRCAAQQSRGEAARHVEWRFRRERHAGA
jgi:hypothetical protein